MARQVILKQDRVLFGTALALYLCGPVAAASLLYDEASAKLKNVPDQKQLDLIALQSPGPYLLSDKRAGALLRDNRQAIELFKRAAAQKGDGHLFGPKPLTLDYKTPMPSYSDKIKLFKLLLLEADMHLASGHAHSAQKDYLAAVDFLIHLSEEKSGVLLAVLVEVLCMEKAHASLERSIRGAPASAYLRELSSRLEALERNQDFLAAAFVEEEEMGKNSVRLIEKDVRKGGRFDPTVSMSSASVRVSLPFPHHLLDSDFFSEFYRLLDAANEDFTRATMLAARENTIEGLAALDRKVKQDNDAAAQEAERRGWWDYIRSVLKGSRYMKLRHAETASLILRSIPRPSYSKIIPPYHCLYCRIEILRAAVAVKRYQRARHRLPDGLGQLVPQYLPRVPLDSFDRYGPLRYVKNGNSFKVYSIGPDRKDDGGSDHDLDASKDEFLRGSGDIVFSD